MRVQLHIKTSHHEGGWEQRNKDLRAILEKLYDPPQEQLNRVGSWAGRGRGGGWKAEWEARVCARVCVLVGRCVRACMCVLVGRCV